MIQSDAKSLEESPIIKVSISAMATLEKLYETFVSVLNLNVPADYRVWKVDGLDLDGAQYPSGKLLADGGILFPLLNDNAQMSKTLEEAIVQSEDSFVVEVAVGGKWIVDANSVPKTPDIVTGTTYSDSEASRKEAGPLFKPGTDFFSKMQSNGSGANKVKVDSSGTKPGVMDGFYDAAVSKGLIFAPNLSSKFSGFGKGKVEKGPTVQPGLLGLGNMCVFVASLPLSYSHKNICRGNTCFMNSALQCLAHTEPLVEYFLSKNQSLTLLGRAKLFFYSGRLPGRVES